MRRSRDPGTDCVLQSVGAAFTRGRPTLGLQLTQDRTLLQQTHPDLPTHRLSHRGTRFLQVYPPRVHPAPTELRTQGVRISTRCAHSGCTLLQQIDSTHTRCALACLLQQIHSPRVRPTP